MRGNSCSRFAALYTNDATIAAIRAKYSGTPVGASESIFAMLAPALGLNLITPQAFLKAISEGTDVSAADKNFYEGKVAAARFFAATVLPELAARRSVVESTDLGLMDLPAAAF